MAIPTPRVFTIPASAPFLPTLIGALVNGKLVPGFPAARDPLALAQATIYLPTRPACRLARDIFLQTQKADAAILPRIVAIGGVDEDEIGFSEAAAGDIAADVLDLPPPLGGFERNVLLAELILKWANSPEMRRDGGASLVASNPAGALRLANDLAHLMDDMTTRQVPWDKLDGLVPEEVDEYWQFTLRFLKIAREIWPAVLAERGLIEPAERRNKLIAAEAQRLARSDAPVIAAGSTGSIPATAVLLDTIAKLPHGAVVLPGLDTEIDPPAWTMIGSEDAPAPSHPQFAMQALLRRIGIAREAVTTLAPSAAYGRERLVSEAMRPAAATERWQASLAADGFATHADAALDSIAVIEAANAEEEALAIAVALRETVETPDQTAALVTPDRTLARRVLAALARWNVAADDSRGEPLAETPAGIFARLVAETGLSGLAPVTLLALLKHPLCRVDASAVATLERTVLRGPRPRPGTAGLGPALAAFRASRDSLHHSDPRRGLTDAELEAAGQLVARLAEAIAPLENLPAGTQSFAAIAEQHRKVVEALGGETPDLAEAFDDIAKASRLVVSADDYAELFHAALADRTAHRPIANARVRILGTLESRLQSVDRMVLGGLVESTWPPETRADPWLSRPMRQALGLDLPERRIGLSAHDFAQALGAKEIVLSRAARLSGAPTVASRFVQRLAAVAGEPRWNKAIERGNNYLAWARGLDAPAKPPVPAKRPSPTPPLEARPRQLSVTEIEHWLRDPYTIYAKRVLKLEPLDDIDAPPDAADRGTLIHNSIGEFAKAFDKTMPADPVRELTEIGERHFARWSDYPEVRAFWWPRFLRIAEWFARAEIVRRTKLARFDAEIGGHVEIPFGKETFKLTVRADRIECLRDGRYAILDYKTGAPPTEPQVRSGLSPQLTLEAAILRKGGFKGIAAGGCVAELVYVRLRGGADAGEELPIRFKEGTADEHADHALARLTKLIATFADPAVPYHSLVHPMWTTHYGTYDHLARVQEWSLTGGTSENGGGE